MKTTTFKTMLMALAMVFCTIAAQAIDKTTTKARAVIEKAAPDDWESYAKAAKMCIQKKVNLAEAKSWLDRSLEIKENAFAHEVAGDYFNINKIYDKAVNHYVKSMMLTKQSDFYADVSELQKKIERTKSKI
ncbi:hypothetical protein E1176_15785 [Fulvivirga sp. RKSG066]|uniref:hypothetical protein n=1 Tax=Fulvivirga aurantia TaxID=2529383 RepID=UPI0012BD44AE|nr:hypothetical protein [Fulvivirga aurantia]MTI22493.1 hypothetical protein [Fulvivirga aurantia]